MAVYDDIGTREHTNQTISAIKRLMDDSECETISRIAQGALWGYEQEMVYYRRNLANGLFWHSDEAIILGALEHDSESGPEQTKGEQMAEIHFAWAQESLARAGRYLSLVHLLDDGER